MPLSSLHYLDVYGKLARVQGIIDALIECIKCTKPKSSLNEQNHKAETIKQHILKIVNNCLNTNIYSYLEASGGPSYNPYLNVGHFFQHQSKLDICDSLRQLFSCIGI
jgi:hypothetical protein